MQFQLQPMLLPQQLLIGEWRGWGVIWRIKHLISTKSWCGQGRKDLRRRITLSPPNNMKWGRNQRGWVFSSNFWRGKQNFCAQEEKEKKKKVFSFPSKGCLKKSGVGWAVTRDSLSTLTLLEKEAYTLLFQSLKSKRTLSSRLKWTPPTTSS